MPYYAVNYGFSQKFPFPAQDAYNWCVDFRADDWHRMGKKGSRKVMRIDDNTVILDDTGVYGGTSETRTRLVKLYPGLLMWTNTRISKAGKYSQFVYRVIPEGETRSRLEFTGAQVEESDKELTTAEVVAMAEENEKADREVWVLLAKAMKKDLSAGR